MDAATLRIILLIVGIAFLLALFLWERHRAARGVAGRETGASPRRSAKREPNLGPTLRVSDRDDWQPGREDIPDWDQAARHDPASYSPPTQEADHPQADSGNANVPNDSWNEDYAEERTGDTDPADIDGIVTDTDEGPIIQVFLVARDNTLSGRDILAAASRHLLMAGNKDIFHRIDGDPGQPRTLFSMANLVQPGNFPLHPDPVEAMADFETRGIALFTQMHGEYRDLEALDAMLTTAKSLARELSAEVEDAQHRPISVKRIESLRNAVIDHANPGDESANADTARERYPRRARHTSP